jgi:hypothetical protein
MLDLSRRTGFRYAVVGLLFYSTAAFARGATPLSKDSITVTVTALAPKDGPAPVIPKEDVTAFSGPTRLKVTRWLRARANEANLQLAVLIDNDIGIGVMGEQMQDLANFINSQPSSTSVGIFYAEYGAATAAIRFTTDHAAAANSLRLTLGASGESPSIYLSLSDLVSHWPSSGVARREVLVIASGFDPLYPGVEDPYAASTIDDAERAGINVHTILIPRARYAETFRDNISEAKLLQVTTGAGGQVLFDGAFVPLSLTPFLNQLNVVLKNQYLLTFAIDRDRKKRGELRPFHVQTEEKSVKLYAAKQVLVPGPSQLPPNYPLPR